VEGEGVKGRSNSSKACDNAKADGDNEAKGGDGGEAAEEEEGEGWMYLGPKNVQLQR
jgi:hypothetical protein